MLINIVLIGETTVGKTTFFNRIKHGTEWQLKSHICTMGTELHTYHDQDNNLIRLYDTSGLTKFKSITMSYIKGTHVFILMYSIDDKKSFDNLINWVKFIEHYRNLSIIPKYVVIANKIDLVDHNGMLEKGQSLASSINALFYKISLKNASSASYIIVDSVQCIVMKHQEIDELELESCYDSCTIL